MIEHHDITAEEARAVITPVLKNDAEALLMEQHLAATERLIGTYTNGKPLAVFGASRLSFVSEDAFCWFQEVADLKPHRVSFARASGQLRDMMLQDFTTLTGMTQAKSSIAWLRWLGAEIDPRNPQGWCPFTFRRANG